jgi:hypothetical protein
MYKHLACSKHTDCLWGPPILLLMGTRDILLGVKWLRYEADHASLSGSRISKEWSSAYTYIFAFMCGWGQLYLFMTSSTCCKINFIFKGLEVKVVHSDLF